MSQHDHQLSKILLEQLQSERLVILHTVDAQTKGPTSTVISWVYAINAQQLRFAVDSRSRVVTNVQHHPQITFTLFVGSTVYEIVGDATIVKESLDDVPFQLTCIDMHIKSIRDVMFYGSRITVQPEFEKTYDKRAAEKLDQQVFQAMKKA